MQLFEEDSAEFNKLAQDCCDKQTFGIMKTEAAKLLEGLCDQFSGAAEYVVQHCIISIKVRLGIDLNFQKNA